MEKDLLVRPSFADGKRKAVTFSYDDGVSQDIRLISLLDRYGLKATFNLNSELLGREDYLVREGVKVGHIKIKSDEVRQVYAGHEIAVHTLTHPNLAQMTDDTEIIRQVEQDRINLSELAGYEVVGMAYPGGGINYTFHAAELIAAHTGVRYARTTVCDRSFSPQENLFEFKPTVYHIMEMDKLFEIGQQFLDSQGSGLQVLYVWGHSYEFDIHNTWDKFEEFLKMISGHETIFYGTNRDILLSEAYRI